MHFQKLQVYVEGALGIKNPNMSPGAASSISLSRFVSFIHSFFLSSFLSFVLNVVVLVDEWEWCVFLDSHHTNQLL
jgi:hypothetical protein